MIKTVVGIDNGVSGGLVAVDGHGALIFKSVMPIKKSRKANEVDIAAVVRLLEVSFGVEDLEEMHSKDIVFVIEEPGGSKNAKAATSMAGSFHSFRGMFETLLVQWERITPQQWQKVMLPGCKSGETKLRAASRVKELWPHESFLPTDRCTKLDEGMVDAALIAEYGRRMGF